MPERAIEVILEEVLSGKVEAYRLVNPQEVVTAEWVRLKCQYGCDGYGQSLTCPPYSPTPGITRKVLDSYCCAVLIWKPKEWQNLRELDSVKNFVSEHMLLFLPLSHTSYSSC